MLALSRYHSGTEKLRNTSTNINPANLISRLLRVEICKIHEYELKEIHPENLQGKKKYGQKDWPIHWFQSYEMIFRAEKLEENTRTQIYAYIFPYTFA